MDKCGELVNCICSQLYYPVEHVAWAADQQLVNVASTPLWTLAIVLWGLPLLITLVRKFKQLVQLRAQIQHRSAISVTDPSKRTLESAQGLYSQQRALVVDMIQSLCDIILAVFWMPPGFLWGGKMPVTWWGLFGTISSLIGLYKTIACQ